MSGGASNQAPRLVLASGSPRRRDILARLGFRFTVRPVEIDETERPGEPAVDYVGRLAEEKARADAREREVVLAADTIVALEGELLGKPANEDEAMAMLGRLAGRPHQVLTGVAVFESDHDRLDIATETTTVRFAPLDRTEIAWYVATGEPLDKAGSYAVQGLGSLFVEAVEGNYSNVVGLPVPLVYRLLRTRGIFPAEGEPS